MRYAAHGHHRWRGTVRYGPDDGSGYGGASLGRDAARQLSTHGGRFAPRPGDCGRRAGRGHHHGLAGRPARGDWRGRGRRAGRHFPWHPAVLRSGGPAEFQHGQDRRSTKRISPCAPSADPVVSEGFGAHDRNRDGPAIPQIDKNPKTEDPIVVIYPNPTAEWLNISTINQSNMEIQIFDINSKNVLTLQSKESLTTINIINFANGIYILKVISNEFIYTNRFCKY